MVAWTPVGVMVAVALVTIDKLLMPNKQLDLFAAVKAYSGQSKVRDPN